MGCAPSAPATGGKPPRPPSKRLRSLRDRDKHGGRDGAPAAVPAAELPRELWALLLTDGPLAPPDLAARILTSGGTRVLPLPGAGFSVRYAFATLRGFYPEAPDKPNQDAVAAHEGFGGDADQLLVGVFDGHGNHGSAASQFVMEKVGEREGEKDGG